MVIKMLYHKEIPVKKQTDIFIAGGGPAGIAAAVAAARKGRSVFLAETFGSFGGAAAHALVPAFMQFSDGIHFLAEGIGREIYDAIHENCPKTSKPYCPMGIPIETLKLVCDDMMVNAGVDFAFFTSVIDVECEEGNLTHVVCAGKGELYAVTAKIYIDCTGDGDLCAMAGADYSKGDENGSMMAATLCGLWSGIDWTRRTAPDSRKLEEAFADHIFTNEDRHLPGMWQLSDELGGSNAGHIYGVDGTQAGSLTQAMVEGRKQIQEYRRYYREYLSGFEQAELVVTGTQIGVRESRRILGDYILNVEDFKKRAIFEDEIGRYSYPVDIHAAQNTRDDYELYKTNFETLRYQKGESYGIPMRSLMVKGFDNLLTAGRCISADRAMQSSIRVMPGCYITGQAAGIAGALAAEKNTVIRNVPIYDIQKSLVDMGAYLPNFQK